MYITVLKVYNMGTDCAKNVFEIGLLCVGVLAGVWIGISYNKEQPKPLTHNPYWFDAAQTIAMGVYSVFMYWLHFIGTIGSFLRLIILSELASMCVLAKQTVQTCYMLMCLLFDVALVYYTVFHFRKLKLIARKDYAKVSTRIKSAVQSLCKRFVENTGDISK